MGAFKPGKEWQSGHPPYPVCWLHNSSEVFVTGTAASTEAKIRESWRVNYFNMPALDDLAPIPQCTQAVRMRSVIM